MVDLIELSIEETNKLRAQIGLSLIPTTELDSGKNDPRSFSVGHMTNKRDSVALKLDFSEPLEHSNGAGKYANEVTGKAVGSSDNLKNRSKLQPVNKLKQLKVASFDYDVDLDSWLDNISNKSKHPNVASKTTDPDTSDDETQPHTTVKHGVKKLSYLGDGEIFTLEDRGILDDIGDELVNESLMKEEKLAQNVEERQKEGFWKFGRPSLVGDNVEDDNSHDSETEWALLQGSTILLQLAPPKKKKKKYEMTAGNTVCIEGLFGDLEPSRPIVSMKKMKVKKMRGGSKKRHREEVMVETVGLMYTAELQADDELLDDFEEMHSRSRGQKNKARKTMSAQDIAHEARLHKRADFSAEVEAGFVYDDTKDFLDTISALLEENSNFSLGANLFKNAEGPDKNVKFGKEQLTMEIEGGEEVSVNGKNSDPTADRLELEPANHNLNSLLSTLKYLRTKTDLLDTEKPKRSKAEMEHQREAELAKIQINIEERLIREHMAQDPVFLKMTNKEQEQVIDQHVNSTLVEKRIIAETKRNTKYARYSSPADPLKDYSPRVSVEYKDSQGNKLNSKQAWKELLHRYHGLAPKHKKDPATRKSTEERIIL